MTHIVIIDTQFSFCLKNYQEKNPYIRSLMNVVAMMEAWSGAFSSLSWEELRQGRDSTQARKW